MPDLEKVKEGLRCCILKDPDDSRDCKHCPRCNYGAFITNSCINGLLVDSLALLETPGQRILELSELTTDTVYWIEQDTIARPWPTAMYQINSSFHEDYMGERWKDEEYGKTWRCWSQMPTNEQMEATAWA